MIFYCVHVDMLFRLIYNSLAVCAVSMPTPASSRMRGKQTCKMTTHLATSALLPCPPCPSRSLSIDNRDSCVIANFLSSIMIASLDSPEIFASDGTERLVPDSMLQKIRAKTNLRCGFASTVQKRRLLASDGSFQIL